MSGSEIIVVVVKCFRAAVDPPNLAMLLDAFLQGQGYEVRDVIVRIEEADDETALHPSG